MTLAAKRGQASWRESRSFAVGIKRAVASHVSSVRPSPSHRHRQRGWRPIEDVDKQHLITIYVHVLYLILDLIRI